MGVRRQSHGDWGRPKGNRVRIPTIGMDDGATTAPPVDLPSGSQAPIDGRPTPRRIQRRWKVLLLVPAALVPLLVANAIDLDHQTEPAGVTIPGAQILHLKGGDLQALDVRPRHRDTVAQPPLVLIHCYTCAIDWWERMIPSLSRTHRVVAIDLLGHGGSEKPGSGYAIENQARLVAQALDRLDVRRAVVVGHSLGGDVVTDLAQRNPRLVGRLVIIDQNPSQRFAPSTPFLANLARAPVLGEALWRILPDSAIRSSIAEAFAPGYDVPDPFIQDVRRMTYTAFDASQAANEAYWTQESLVRRITASAVPLMVIFGAEDQLFDARSALRAYRKVSGARTTLIRGAGHSPNVEKPRLTARLILSFAESRPPKRSTLRSAANGPATEGKPNRQIVALGGDALGRSPKGSPPGPVGRH